MTVFEVITDEQEHIERAILVGIDRGDKDWPLSESMAELARLVDTAGAKVVAQTYQKLEAPNPRTFVGKGKAEEVALMTQEYDAQLVVFDDELSPSQQNNLEKVLKGVKVIDRTALILDIFSLHALTKEGRLQVRLAQNQYLYPRLRGMWAHLASNRMGGGVGSRFGEGESQLEVDRRMVRKRIDKIRAELSKLEQDRSVQRKSRYADGVTKISLVGYTNAGKSTLLNRLTGSNVLAEDKLFATLDSTTRRYVLPEGRKVTITDTVGFIQKLPTTLVEAFKSTLDEVSGSDLILMVCDASSEKMDAQYKAVQKVLDQIGAVAIPHIMVLNKVDLLDEHDVDTLRRRYPAAVCISALEDTGINELIARISQACAASDVTMHVTIPYSRGELVELAHDKCTIVSVRYGEQGTEIDLKCPESLVSRFSEYRTDNLDGMADHASDAYGHAGSSEPASARADLQQTAVADATEPAGAAGYSNE